jgi:hypothetical protein
MTNQDSNQNKVIPFTFNGVSFDVATTGNADADFQIGNSMLFFYLKNLRENFNPNNPIPPAPATLQNIISTLENDATLADVKRGFLVALDILLQPITYAMRNVFDELSDDDLLSMDVTILNIPTAE